ncbi:uncharacterized protein P174DRAFT_293856 [Aspergillus novofumigatus IBT 16806]|uniref:Uncharacterized protein n=1 Tax=Aspergillus novofumigatus (strain IBT 16806) TaxID=1392255 RepID=A0A2I1BY50_ASPN1|nr:uncharacterized protein P174DRAFT_293856 [Aspergillus novofumigatus IBT 16806]PKX90299.1 hypothetical protein P174DRAFT_293856 [Aspergillus novofumigatus IBT 16806]
MSALFTARLSSFYLNLSQCSSSCHYPFLDVSLVVHPRPNVPFYSRHIRPLGYVAHVTAIQIVYALSPLPFFVFPHVSYTLRAGILAKSSSLMSFS